MTSANTYSRVYLLVATTVLVVGVAWPARAARPLPASRVFGHLVGRAIVTPAGDLEVVGYYALLEGIPGPFFAGAPSEATAFFTFRSDPLSFSDVFVNGSIAWAESAPSKLKVYLSATPHGDWNDPDSFSSGQLIATFDRRGELFTCNGNLTLLNTCTDALSRKLLSSEDFTFNGRTFNLKKLIPNGVTTVSVVDTSFPGFSAVFVGYDLVIGNTED